jgi:hypothetical protein
MKQEEINSLIGKTFNRLTVLGVAGKDKRGATLFLCKCSCGQTTTALAYKLRSGEKKSCGCLSKEMAKKRLTKHGECGTRLHVLWKSVKSRCYNKNNLNYKNYGGRGIKMYEEWKSNFTSFRDFMLSIGYDETLPTGEQTIERIDVNGDYEPNNCKLISKREQNYNKRNNHYVTYKGETKTVSELAEEYGIDVDIILNRINHFGYTIEEAIERPIIHKPRKVPTYTIDGVTKTKREWAKEVGLSYSQLKSKTRRRSVEEVVKELKGSI